MEEFGISLKTIHDKLSEKDILHTIEIDDMFSKMRSIDENDIKKEKEIYVMLQDVFSYMRDTGITDRYLLIVFPEDYKEDNEEDTVDNLVAEYIDNLGNLVPQHDEKSGAKLLVMKERVSNFLRVASLRDPDHIQKDNERYGDMLDFLEEMMNIIYFLKGINEGKKTSGYIERIIAKEDAEREKIDKNEEVERATIDKNEEVERATIDKNEESDEADTSGISEESSDEEIEDFNIDFFNNARIPSVVM